MMTALEKLTSLSPNYVTAYLIQNGWENQGKFGAFSRIFSKYDTLENSVAEVVVPMKSNLVDYAKRMSELIADIAKLEDRPPSSVLFDLALSPYDVIKVRDLEADAHGSVPFEEGLGLHAEAKNMVIAAARAAASDQPRRAWRGRRPEVVNDYLNKVRLGQTEQRSYSITLLSPYAYDPSIQVPLWDTDPFGRRVSRMIGGSLAAIERSLVESVGADLEVFDAAVPEGVSADLCFALSNLAASTSSVEISISWSPARPYAQPFSLQLSRDDGAILAEVGKGLSAQEPDTDAVIEGPISVIEGASGLSGNAVVDCLIDGRMRRVRVHYDEDQRSDVFDAAERRLWVRLSGDLIREGRGLRLANSRGLTVLTPHEG